MATFKETIAAHTIAALKGSEALRVSVLRMLSAALHNREIEKRATLRRAQGGGGGEAGLSDEEALAVLRSEAKKRRDAIAEFGRGGRKDLAEKEAAELAILEAYLPRELDEAALTAIVRDVVAEGKFTANDFGRAMGEAMKRVKGQASGDRVAALVRKYIAE